MPTPASRAAAVALSVTFALGSPFPPAVDGAAESESREENPQIMRATGTFEVELAPLDSYNRSAEARIGRMSIDKTFAGDLAGTSQGEMLTGGSPAEGSAGYVAIERVTGTLHGRSGSFLLQHSGTMTPESRELRISVVPASGTGELEGIAGTMSIEIDEGKHAYELEYTLPDSS